MSAQRCKVYLLELTEDAPWRYESPQAMVIVDASPGAARATACSWARHVNSAGGDQDPEFWIKARYTSCKGIGYAFKSYAAGTVLHVNVHEG